jgi:branched-chain amino acid transport system ATP-binding protein
MTPRFAVPIWGLESEVFDMLKVKNLQVFRGGKAVLHGIDVDVPAGEITAMVGPNGAGKSSTVLAIGGVIPAAGGSMELDGKNILGHRAEAVRRAGLAIVPEGHRVLGGLTVRDNLLVAASQLPAVRTASEIERMLSIFPELESKLDVLGRALSGGQKQMVCVAQALMSAPKVLVIDELSLGLAPLIVKRLADVLKLIAKQGVGVLLIEQFTTLALSISSSALVLERGRVAYAGSADYLRDRPDILHGSYLATRADA